MSLLAFVVSVRARPRPAAWEVYTPAAALRDVVGACLDARHASRNGRGDVRTPRLAVLGLLVSMAAASAASPGERPSKAGEDYLGEGLRERVAWLKRAVAETPTAEADDARKRALVLYDWINAWARAGSTTGSTPGRAPAATFRSTRRRWSR